MAEHHKKREMGTYRRLDLSRHHKYRSRRDATASGGLYCYIGGTDPDRPWMKVARADYHRIWNELAAARAAGRKVRDLDRVTLENLVYDRMLHERLYLESLEDSFRTKHGRGMTPHERELYARLAPPEKAPDPRERAASVRRIWMRGLLDKIRDKQEGRPQRLQEVWAAVVGAEAAMETTLEKVDGFKGIAYCRAQSSSQAHALRRRPEIAAKLSEALGVRLKRIVFR